MTYDTTTTYRTRNGCEGRIDVLDDGAGRMLGRFKNGHIWVQMRWLKDGSAAGVGLRDLDIISTWDPVPEVNWDTIPPRFGYLAIDKNGVCYLCEVYPNMGDIHWNRANDLVQIPNSDRSFYIKNLGELKDIDFRHALVERPKKS